MTISGRRSWTQDHPPCAPSGVESTMATSIRAVLSIDCGVVGVVSFTDEGASISWVHATDSAWGRTKMYLAFTRPPWPRRPRSGD